MDPEEYLREYKRLSQALCGADRLKAAIEDIAITLQKYNLDAMPMTAFDVTQITLQSLCMERVKFHA